MRYREIIAAEAATEAGLIKPKKPLTPAQARLKSERRAGIEKRIRDQQANSAQKVADLRDELED
ncbi:hypothetical protein ACLBXO_18685 [Methylobacterium sp. C33D]